MKYLKFGRSFGIVLLIMCWTVNILPSGFHTYHTSLTRIDYNDKEKLIEISIQLFTHDLEPVLEKFSKKRVDLGKTPEIDRLILKYLDENFVIADKKGNVLKLEWVGKELQADTIFIYVEVPLKESFEGFKIKNSIFFESFPEQTNLVIARFDGKKADLLFKVGDKFKEIIPVDVTKSK